MKRCRLAAVQIMRIVIKGRNSTQLRLLHRSVVPIRVAPPRSPTLAVAVSAPNITCWNYHLQNTVTATNCSRRWVVSRSVSDAVDANDAGDEEGFAEEEEEEFIDELQEDDDTSGPEVNTAGTDWGERILEATRRLLHAGTDLQLYSFRAHPNSKRVDIRIDKLSNPFGSPSLDEVGDFSRALGEQIEISMGEEAAGEIEIEVSSPGAERHVKVPSEFERFHQLPMSVEYEETSVDGGDDISVQVQRRILQFVDVDETGDVSRWRLANVRKNRSGKGRPLNKRQRETIMEIQIGSIKCVTLHLAV